MSDFTENLRHFTEVGSGYTVDGIMRAAADRIESLEAQLQEGREAAALLAQLGSLGRIEIIHWESAGQVWIGIYNRDRQRIGEGETLRKAISNAAMSQEKADHDQQ